MLAERFRPSDIESLVRIAGALAPSPAAAELPPQTAATYVWGPAG